MPLNAADAAGWYGKIASLGDFASRRLPRSFIERWDGWLQQVIDASRLQLGAGWLDAYLGCPVWRFVLFPGLCGEQTWGGVMMPSVDRVGRYFPLLIVAELDGFATAEREFAALNAWFDHLETLALSTLDTTRSAEGFDAELAALRAPPIAAPRAALARRIIATLREDDAALLSLPSGDEIAHTLIDAGAILLGEAARGGSLWWTATEPGACATLLACRGLPDGNRFAAMLQSPSSRSA